VSTPPTPTPPAPNPSPGDGLEAEVLDLLLQSLPEEHRAIVPKSATKAVQLEVIKNLRELKTSPQARKGQPQSPIPANAQGESAPKPLPKLVELNHIRTWNAQTLRERLA
jgi:hypothetical protein